MYTGREYETEHWCGDLRSSVRTGDAAPRAAVAARRGAAVARFLHSLNQSREVPPPVRMAGRCSALLRSLSCWRPLYLLHLWVVHNSLIERSPEDNIPIEGNVYSANRNAVLALRARAVTPCATANCGTEVCLSFFAEFGRPARLRRRTFLG